MHTLKHTLTGIGQTGIDLVKCTRFRSVSVRQEQIICSGIGLLALAMPATALGICRLEGATLGIGAAIGRWVVSSTLSGSATLGSTILGIYGAREGSLRISAIGGALVGITTTGCTILAAPILGGNPVGLASSAALLGLGGAGGALLAIATGLAAKSEESSTQGVSGILMGAGGGFLLGAGIAGGLFGGLPITEAATLSSTMVVGLNAIVSVGILHRMEAFSSRALFIDRELQSMITNVHQYSNHFIFGDLLNKKNILSVFNLSDASISYSKLLHKIIDYSAPPKWFEMSLKQPGIDPNLPNAYGQTLAHSIVRKFYQYTGEQQQKLYLEYLEYLLLDPRNNPQATLDIIFTNYSKSKPNLNKEIFKVLLLNISQEDMQKAINKMPENLSIAINTIMDEITLETQEIVVRIKSAAKNTVEIVGHIQQSTSEQELQVLGEDTNAQDN